MEPNYRITYRSGLMEPSDDYIPEITRSKPAWSTTNRFPDYGPVVEDDLIPSHSINEPTFPYQKMQYTKLFPNPASTTEITRDKNEFDLVEKSPHRSKPPIVSSQREPLHMLDIFDHQDITEREWKQRKLQGITNMSNLHDYINKLWEEVNVATSYLTDTEYGDNLAELLSKLEALPEDNARIDAQELDELRELGVIIPQRVNRSDAVKRAIQRHIDKLESMSEKNI